MPKSKRSPKRRLSHKKNFPKTASVVKDRTLRKRAMKQMQAMINQQRNKQLLEELQEKGPKILKELGLDEEE